MFFYHQKDSSFCSNLMLNQKIGLNKIYNMPLLALILLAFLILGTIAQHQRDEKHQLVGALRAVVISVQEKIPLELCSVL